MVADCLSSRRCASRSELLNLGLPRVLYWPSFEVVRWLSGHAGKMFGSGDGSAHHVDFKVINRIMDVFVERFGDDALQAATAAFVVCSGK